jgi:hypothetical protein
VRDITVLTHSISILTPSYCFQAKQERPAKLTKAPKHRVSDLIGNRIIFILNSKIDETQDNIQKAKLERMCEFSTTLKQTFEKKMPPIIKSDTGVPTSC